MHDLGHTRMSQLRHGKTVVLGATGGRLKMHRKTRLTIKSSALGSRIIRSLDGAGLADKITIKPRSLSRESMDVTASLARSRSSEPGNGAAAVAALLVAVVPAWPGPAPRPARGGYNQRDGCVSGFRDGNAVAPRDGLLAPGARMNRIARLLAWLAAALLAGAVGLSAPARADVFWTSATNGGPAIGHASDDGTNVNPSFIVPSSDVFHSLTAIAVGGGYVYWALTLNGNIGSPSAIGRAKIDGSDVTPNLITGPRSVSGLAVDGSHIYWSDNQNNGSANIPSIGRANLDGTGVNENFITPPTGTALVHRVAVDPSHIYWEDQPLSGATSIADANLDSSGINPSLVPNVAERNLALDSSHLYFDTFANNAFVVNRANLDGTGATSILTPGYTALAVGGGHVFFVDGGGDEVKNNIGRVNSDGTAPNLTLIPSVGAGAIAVSPTSGPTVSVSLTPDKVNICGNTCARDNAVNATVSVTGADGKKLSGQYVALRADDPGVAVSPVTDAGAGTYTATLHPSHTPGPAIVTATDNSATPAVSGSATLTQECNPHAGAAGDVHPGGSVARVAAAGHCTATTMKCLNATQPIPAACVITVTDKSATAPTPPTGEVKTSVTVVSSRLPQLSPSCTLTPTPAATRSSACIVEWQPRGELSRKVQYSIHASYDADPRHIASVGDGSFTLIPEVPPPSWSSKAGKDILKNSGDYLGAAAKTVAVPFVASKIPGATGVPAFFAKGAALQLSLAAFAGLEVASAGVKACADFIDPFDRRYKVVATPKPRRVPTVPVRGARNRRMVSSFQNTIEQQLAVMTVLGTTENRASSAKKVGDKHAYRLQERAISRYLVRLAHLVDAQRSSQIAIQQTLNRMFAAAHVGPVLRLRIPAAEYRAAVESGQVGAEVTRQLTQLGEGSASVLGFISRVVNTPIPARINMSTVFASSAIIKALRQEAAMLRAEARKVPLR